MKSAVVLICLALVAGYSAVPVKDPRGNLASNALENYVENNKDKWANLKIPSVSLGGSSELTDIIATGLETVQAKAEGAPIHPMVISNLTLTIAELDVDGWYHFDNLFVDGIGTLNGAGKLKGKFTGCSVVVDNIKIQINEKLSISVEDFGILRVNTSKNEVNLDGQNPEINNQLPNLVTTLLNYLEQFCKEEKQKCIDMVNEYI